MKRWHILFALLALTACDIKPQVVAVVDDNSNSQGALGVYFVHFPAGSPDQVDKDEHYGLAVQSDKEKPFPNFSKIAAVGVKSSVDKQFLTDTTHLCAQATDPIFDAPAFGCRLPLSTTKVGKIRLDLLMSDGSTLSTDDIDTGVQYDGDVLQIPATISNISESTAAKDFTLKACPASADGNQEVLPVSKVCPTQTSEKASTDSPEAEATSSCTAPNYIDNSGKCVSVAESKKDLCASGNYILLGGKGCGTTCGANQVAKLGMCVCQTNFIPDPANPQNCVVNPALNQNLPVSSPSSGGGSCSLIREK